MAYVIYIVLGLVQGLTEFLPISSSGHLVLFARVFGVEETLFVSIMLHVATLLSICMVMWREIWQLIRKPFSKEAIKLFISTLSTVAIVMVLFDFAKQTYIDNFVSIYFMVTACFMILADLFAPKKACGGINKKQALFMGVAQGLAVFPGISRSGATICAGIFSGAEKEKVAKHSFLMSIPIILASLMMEILELSSTTISTPIFPLFIGFLVAFLSGVLSLKFMLRLICKIRFRYFAYYLIFISLISLFI